MKTSLANTTFSLVSPLNAIGVRFRQVVAWSAALCMLGIFAGTPAAGQAGDPVLPGIDLWKTVDGANATWKGFNQVCPIPVGFFCPDADPTCTTSAGSDAINTGQIRFQGDPLGGPFGDADTIVQRLGQADVSVKKVMVCNPGCAPVCNPACPPVCNPECLVCNLECPLVCDPACLVCDLECPLVCDPECLVCDLECPLVCDPACDPVQVCNPNCSKEVCECTDDFVDIKIVALSLKGTDPVMVTYSGGDPPEEWTVRACLSDGPQNVGTMEIRHECFDGGTFVSALEVFPKLIFSRPGRNDLTLEPGDPCAPILFTASGPWVHDFADALVVIGPVQVDGNCDGILDPELPGTSNFVPGVTPFPCDPLCTLTGSCVFSAKTKGEVPETAPDAKHTVTPPGPGVPPPPPPPPPTGTPTVSEWGMIILMLLLLSGIAIKFGRQGKATEEG